METSAARKTNVPEFSTAYYLLEGLKETGIDYLFCNFGTDHAPLIEAMAQFRRDGRKLPATILCPHENTAVHMAAGYAVATGRGQGVMVHVDAGTANAAMALHNLCRARVPVMLMAGKAPFTTRGELLGTRDTYVHFVQEPFDQALDALSVDPRATSSRQFAELIVRDGERWKAVAAKANIRLE